MVSLDKAMTSSYRLTIVAAMSSSAAVWPQFKRKVAASVHHIWVCRLLAGRCANGTVPKQLPTGILALIVLQHLTAALTQHVWNCNHLWEIAFCPRPKVERWPSDIGAVRSAFLSGSWASCSL